MSWQHRRPVAPRRRSARGALAGLALVLVAAGTVAVAPSADAATAAVHIVTTDTGQLEAVFPQPVIWAQLTVHDTDTGATVLFQTDDLVLEYAADGLAFTAHTDHAVRLPSGTPLGDYVTDVDYRYASGTVQHRAGATDPTTSTFDYAEHAQVSSASVDRAATDYADQTFSVSGTAEVDDPRDGTSAAPAAGTTVEVDGTTYDVQRKAHSFETSGTTDTDGHFNVPVTPGGALSDATVTLVTADPDTVDSAPTALPFVDAVPSQARSYATPTTVRLHAGGSVTLTGVAQILTADGWQPLTHELVGTYVDGLLVASGRTGADGRFSYQLRRYSAADADTEVVATPYLTAMNYTDTSIAVPTRATLSGLRLALDAYGTVTGKGTVHGPCGSQSLALEVSSNGRTGWHRLASTTTAYGSTSCSFSLHADGYVNAYYRVTHAESDAMLALVSPVSHLYRTPTRITGLHLSPSRPTRNGTLTATGQLQQRIGTSWRSLSRGGLVLIWRPRGDTEFYKIKAGRTTTSGRFTMRGKVYGSGAWVVIYQPDGHHFYTETAVRDVKVR
ncbi:hypothetical protein [uncultured Jatrophihabitans sp.]|uniref:hypothetical protein n=1 Tax=uncultured Jatrophihabitans sp. TaxID=1610747 RepID=UPI0035CA7089